MKICQDLELSGTCSIDLFIGEWEFLAEVNKIPENVCYNNLKVPSSNKNRILEDSEIYLTGLTDCCTAVLKGSQSVVPPTHITLVEPNHISFTTYYWFTRTTEIFRRKM